MVRRRAAVALFASACLACAPDEAPSAVFELRAEGGASRALSAGEHSNWWHVQMAVTVPLLVALMARDLCRCAPTAAAASTAASAAGSSCMRIAGARTACTRMVRGATSACDERATSIIRIRSARMIRSGVAL